MENVEKELNERFTREGTMGDGVERVTHCQATQSQQIFFYHGTTACFHLYLKAMLDQQLPCFMMRTQTTKSFMYAWYIVTPRKPKVT